MTDEIVGIVLAAGKGTRMYSRWPKVLHRIAGKYMIEHVLEASRAAGVKKNIIVIGFKGDIVKQRLGDSFCYAYQQEQKGTGHAVMQTRELIAAQVATVLVLCGDVPLLRPETLSRFIQYHRESGASATVLTAFPDEAGSYGRIVRNASGHVERIVEAKDATSQQLEIKEVNTGIYCFERKALFSALKHIRPANIQGEYYLTDVIALFREEGLAVEALPVEDAEEMQGINDRKQLVTAEKILRRRIHDKLLEQGVTLVDPDSVYIDADVEIGRDTIIYPFTSIEGKSKIGCECEVGPGATIRSSALGDCVTLLHSVLVDAVVGDQCTIGPYAYLRPGTILDEGVKIGDFVELKKSKVGKGSKVPHLTYLGDAEVGTHVNIGAGTITCNFDGKSKWPTIIEDDAFIGSNTNLVAPVRVGPGAVIGAGSTITKDVPGGSLGVARGKQINLPKWKEKKFPGGPQ